LWFWSLLVVRDRLVFNNKDSCEQSTSLSSVSIRKIAPKHLINRILERHPFMSQICFGRWKCYTPVAKYQWSIGEMSVAPRSTCRPTVRQPLSVEISTDISVECRATIDRYIARYVDRHISDDISAGCRWICRPTYRSSVGRYIDRYIGRLSVDMSTDTSVEGCTKYTWSKKC